VPVGFAAIKKVIAGAVVAGPGPLRGGA